MTERGPLTLAQKLLVGGIGAFVLVWLGFAGWTWWAANRTAVGWDCGEVSDEVGAATRFESTPGGSDRSNGMIVLGALEGGPQVRCVQSGRQINCKTTGAGLVMAEVDLRRFYWRVPASGAVILGRGMDILCVAP